MTTQYPVNPNASDAPLAPQLRTLHFQLAVPYAIGVSVLYLFGYWGTFQINPLEYAGVGDLVKLAAYPLATVLVLSFFMSVLSYAYFWIIAWSRYGIPTRLKKSVSVLSLIFSLSSLIVVPLLYRYEVAFTAARPGDVWRWVFAGSAALSFFLSYVLSASRPAATISGSRFVRTVVVVTLITPLLCAFPLGRLSANRHLKNGCATLEIDPKRSGVSDLLIGPAAYVGYLGEHTFMREWATGAIVIERIPEGRPLVLLPSKTRADGPQRACNYSGPNAVDEGRPVTSSTIP